MRQLALVFVGSGLGGAARFLMGGWMLRALGTSFPYWTLAVNVLGSFALAVVVQVSAQTNLVKPELQLALTTGFMGGFTTYSTFNQETLSLFQQGRILPGMLNILLTVLVCLAASGLGLWAGRLLTAAS